MHASGTARKRRRSGSFTLIELLLVIGVIGLLLVLALGAYQNIGRATQVDISLTQLKFTMQLARQWAVTHRQTTWVVFPTTRDDNRIRHSTLEVATNVNFRAYGVYAVPTSGSPEMLREWSYLPTAVFFDVRPFVNKNLLRLEAYRVPSAASWPADLRGQPGIAFAPSGALVTQDTDPEIYLSEGMLPGGAGPLTVPTPTGGSTVTNAIQVYRFTGLPQITRYGEDL